MKTRDEIVRAIERLNGAKLTASQLRPFLTKQIGNSTINWHINRLMHSGTLEQLKRSSDKYGNVMRVKNDRTK